MKDKKTDRPIDKDKKSKGLVKTVIKKTAERRPENRKHENPRPADKKAGFEAEQHGKKHYSVDYNEGLIVEGRNAVMELLKTNKTIDKIYVRKGHMEGSITVILARAGEKGVVISEVAKEKLDFMSQSGNHQGVIATLPAYDYAELSDILQIADKKGEDPFIIILDSITDPHNLGAVIRTADCCGAHGVIIPKRRSALLTGIVSKTSAGAIGYVPVARVTNLNSTIDYLKERGVWICCGQIHGKPLFKADLKGPLAIVIGGEDKGVSKLIEKKSDFSVKVPMYGKISSLNASVAASLIMYEVVRQRKFL